uniref:Serpin domain-containing protein n=1 Tax=Ditylenchus dipsaci TaxID=166011 RepID=A0A915DCK1_9BILA
MCRRYRKGKINKMTSNSNALILEAQTDFGLNLLRQSTTNSKASVVLSPLSVAIALSMAYAGARDETEAELNKLLANGQPKEEVHKFFGMMLQKIAKSEKNYTLEAANRIYVKEDYPILEEYKKLLNNHYQGQFESVDFSQSQAAANKINEFVVNATHGKIHDLIEAGSLSGMTRMVLINAIYFKGTWAVQFDPKLTTKKAFYVSEGTEKQVDMMQKTSSFVYSDNGEMQLLGLPYKNNEVFMFVVLPKERYGLENVLKNLTGQSLLGLVQQRQKREVRVILPKFKLESTHTLAPILKNLGLQRSVSSSANFNGVSGSGGLQISEILQKAFIETNEEGTEAAAATAVMIRAMSARPDYVYFTADHPFAYFLVTDAGEVLFNGVVQENH